MKRIIYISLFMLASCFAIGQQTHIRPGGSGSGTSGGTVYSTPSAYLTTAQIQKGSTFVPTTQAVDGDLLLLPKLGNEAIRQGSNWSKKYLDNGLWATTRVNVSGTSGSYTPNLNQGNRLYIGATQNVQVLDPDSINQQTQYEVFVYSIKNNADSTITVNFSTITYKNKGGAGSILEPIDSFTLAPFEEMAVTFQLINVGEVNALIAVDDINRQWAYTAFGGGGGANVSLLPEYAGLIAVAPDSLGFDINGLTNFNVIEALDKFPFFDQSANANRNTSWQNITDQLKDSIGLSSQWYTFMFNSRGQTIDIDGLTDAEKMDTLNYMESITPADEWIYVPPSDYYGTYTANKRVSLWSLPTEFTKFYNDAGHAFVMDRTVFTPYRVKYENIRFETTRATPGSNWDCINITGGNPGATVQFKNCSITESDRDGIHIDADTTTTAFYFVDFRYTTDFDIERYGIYTNSSQTDFDIISTNLDVYFDAAAYDNVVNFSGYSDGVTVTNLGYDNTVTGPRFVNNFNKALSGESGYEVPIRPAPDAYLVRNITLDRLVGSTQSPDLSEYGLNGTIAGTITVAADSLIGPYTSFNGSSNIAFPGISSNVFTNSITIGCLVKVTANTTSYILSKNGVFSIQYVAGGSIIITVTGVVAKTFSGIALNQWYHICYSYDGNRAAIYLNGQQFSTSSSVTASVTNNTNDIYVGSLSNSTSYFTGYVKGLVILNGGGIDIARRLFGQTITSNPPTLSKGAFYKPNSTTAVTENRETIYNNTSFREIKNPTGGFYSTTAATTGALQISIPTGHPTGTYYYEYEIGFYRFGATSTGGKIGSITVSLQSSGTTGYRHGYIIWSEGNTEFTKSVALGRVSTTVPAFVIGDIADVWGSTAWNVVKVDRVLTNAPYDATWALSMTQITSLAGLTILATYVPGNENFSSTVSGNNVIYDNANVKLGIVPFGTTAITDATGTGLTLANSSSTIHPGIKLQSSNNSITSNRQLRGLEWYLGTTPVKVAGIWGLASGTTEDAGILHFGTSTVGTYTDHWRLDQAGTTIFGYNGGSGTDYLTWDNTAKQAAVGGASVTSAKLAVTSTTSGFLPPRMTTTQRNAISSPATGLLIYNTTTNFNNYYNGSAWTEIAGSTISDGTWTPTLTNSINIAASTAFQCQYSKVGSTVTFSGMVEIDPTAAGVTQLGMSLPIASNFSAVEKAGGAGAALDNTAFGIKADATNDRLTITFTAVSTANTQFSFSGSYRIE